MDDYRANYMPFYIKPLWMIKHENKLKEISENYKSEIDFFDCLPVNLKIGYLKIKNKIAR